MKQPFYGDNEHRDYPFINRPDFNSLPHSAIVDFGAIFFPSARFTDYAIDFVYLAAIERVGAKILYRFKTTAAGAVGDDCVFVRDVHSAEEFESQWVRSGDLALEANSSSIGGHAATWEAFLVTGTLDDIVEMLPHDGVVTFDSGLWRIEPARVQTLAGASVTSINVANYPRLELLPAPGCGSVSATETAPIVLAEGMTGDIRLVEGYNVSIRQDTQNVALIIGVGGKNVSLDAGYGFTIKPSQTAPNTLVIAPDPTATAACGTSSEALDPP